MKTNEWTHLESQPTFKLDSDYDIFRSSFKSNFDETENKSFINSVDPVLLPKSPFSQMPNFEDEPSILLNETTQNVKNFIPLSKLAASNISRNGKINNKIKDVFNDISRGSALTVADSLKKIVEVDYFQQTVSESKLWRKKEKKMSIPKASNLKNKNTSGTSLSSVLSYVERKHLHRISGSNSASRNKKSTTIGSYIK